MSEGAVRSQRETWSQREACEVLGARCGMDRETARRVLRAGLAGAGVRLRGTVLYEAAEVEALARRPLLDLGLPRVCHRGTFVARLGARRTVPPERRLRGPDGLPQTWRGADLAAAPAEQLRAASGPWRLSPLARVRLTSMVQRQGFVPFVATTGGFVLLGGDLVAARAAEPGRSSSATMLALADPGDWFDAWRRGRLLTGPGGPWQMWPAGLWQLASIP
ncbi:hypothetical protein [Nocardioides campestrisoli]|uniref:hypothetical protein n=1 Tax=Nocardioides campestrisoli TaxID=2736757 RepID=UPI0015E76B3B|nr:hypothetical protein [Nocardioides campestrisoli]